MTADATRLSCSHYSLAIIIKPRLLALLRRAQFSVLFRIILINHLLNIPFIIAGLYSTGLFFSFVNHSLSHFTILFLSHTFPPAAYILIILQSYTPCLLLLPPSPPSPPSHVPASAESPLFTFRAPIFRFLQSPSSLSSSYLSLLIPPPSSASPAAACAPLAQTPGHVAASLLPLCVQMLSSRCHLLQACLCLNAHNAHHVRHRLLSRALYIIEREQITNSCQPSLVGFDWRCVGACCISTALSCGSKHPSAILHLRSVLASSVLLCHLTPALLWPLTLSSLSSPVSSASCDPPPSSSLFKL